MKHKIITLLIFITTLVGCSKDSISTEEQKGSIEVLVVFEDTNKPVFDAVVALNSSSNALTTGITGIVKFENIEIGNHMISVKVPTSDVVFEENVTVELNKTAKITIEVDPPNPVLPSIIDIDVLLLSSYNSLLMDDVFNAIGYASYWGDIGTDIITTNNKLNPPTRDLNTYNFNTNDKIIEDIWTNHYKIIRNMNVGIKAIEDSDFTTEIGTKPNVAMAEFRFLRALTYFNLIKLYGNPVLVTSTDVNLNDNTVVQDQLKTYEQIEKDLKYVELNLSGVSLPKNRASVSAAQALLGKVYLQMAGFPLLMTNKYETALIQLNKLKGSYALTPNYKDNFNAEKNSNNTEIIFQIDFKLTGNSNENSWDWVNWGPMGATERDHFILTPSFIESYFENPNDLNSPVSFPMNVKDSRFFENIAPFTYENGVSKNEDNSINWRPYKFSKNYQKEVSFHFPYLRYADVLLMIAEAENAVNGPTSIAYDAINQVRRRAFGNSENDINPGISSEEFLNTVLDERRLELCFEGHRKDDLIRTQKLHSVIDDFNLKNPQHQKNYQSYKYIFPIPQIELALNPNAIQNTGYK
ncbi:RagB/SusD family nutrient uptake outer membrane protein [Algibacter sp. 2305UL17-15]|uniref:RagB/SusD family nutrient uptake outer membrane protein n=1 Tax=Algibacter sp. 2305UL17-15 TaxID=3231268 RepID=UPI003459F9AE